MLLADTFANPVFGWNLATDYNELIQYAYMRHAFAASAIVALLGAVVGWFAILRSETYATHTLSMVGFPGASGAALLGVSPLVGFFVFCVSGALAIPALTGRSETSKQNESAAVGSVQALALAFGLWFVSLYHGFLSGVGTFLFGTFTGITSGQVIALALVALITLVALSVMGKRLIFASVDPTAAQTNGINVRAMEVAFLITLGVAVAETSQFTGALLAFTLTVTPAAIAQAITPRPTYAILIAVACGILFAWAGLVAAYFTSYPVGFFVTTFAFGAYVLTLVILRAVRA